MNSIPQACNCLKFYSQPSQLYIFSKLESIEGKVDKILRSVESAPTYMNMVLSSEDEEFDFLTKNK